MMPDETKNASLAWELEQAQQQIAAKDAEIAALRVRAEQAEKTWRCFHCGFETADPKEAEAHFGERDDAEEFKPICNWWHRMSPEERGETLQDTIEELNAERDETAQQRVQIEGLEHRLQEFEQVIDARFPGCRSINDIFHRYDSMEGRALAAEQRAEQAEKSLKELGEQLEFDRTKVAESMTSANKAIDLRYWLTEGRGCYEWNDDRWHDEFRAAAIEIKQALEPLTKISANWSGCPMKAEDIAAARIDLKRRLAECERDKERLDWVQSMVNREKDADITFCCGGVLVIDGGASILDSVRYTEENVRAAIDAARKGGPDAK